MTPLVKKISNLEIGNTELRHLPSLSPEGRPNIKIYMKLEGTNPTGSVKDRIAQYILNNLQETGQLDNIDLIVEASSGNTASAIALQAAVHNVPSRIYIPAKTSLEKEKLTRDLGAEVIRVPANQDYMSVAAEFAKGARRSYFVNQYDNTLNFKAHYDGLGNEILKDMQGMPINAIVGAASTGGTLCGVTKRLKERHPRMRAILADASGSSLYQIFHDRTMPKVNVSATKIEGVGKNRLTDNMDGLNLIDEVRLFSDKRAVDMVFHLRDVEGIYVGGSSGANALIAQQVAEDMARAGVREANIVTWAPDRYEKYTSKFEDPNWVASLQ